MKTSNCINCSAPLSQLSGEHKCLYCGTKYIGQSVMFSNIKKSEMLNKAIMLGMVGFTGVFISSRFMKRR